jgi:hypothetical protein
MQETNRCFQLTGFSLTARYSNQVEQKSTAEIHIRGAFLCKTVSISKAELTRETFYTQPKKCKIIFYGIVRV